jgi:hypothetical protein
VQLRRDISIDGSGGIVLELGGDKLTRGFWQVIAADASLGVTFELFESNGYALSVGLPDTLIGPDERGNGDRLRRREGCVPARSMFHRFDGLAVRILIFIRRPLPD